MGVAQDVCVIVGAEDRARLAAIGGDRSRPLKHVQRARIILGSAERLPVLDVARRAGGGRPAVWRWQRRYAEEGGDALLRDKTPLRQLLQPAMPAGAPSWLRPPGKAPVPASPVARGLALTCAEPPGETPHWTGRAMARTMGLSLRTIQRIWKAHHLQPHRWPTFKRSNDPAFAEKIEDIVGLSMHPAAHAVVLSIDETSQIQALDRTQPGLPLKRGKCQTLTHDDKRHGTTTLFAAFNILDGAVLGRCMQRHTHQEFIRFLNAIERNVPAGKPIHGIIDNYATHKHPKVRAWLARHPRRVFHFTPTSGSWINAVEGFFSALPRRRLKRGIFRSIVDLQAAINRYLAEPNDNPKPFVWTKPAKTILANLNRLPVSSV